jgi:hypothetical protein
VHNFALGVHRAYSLVSAAAACGAHRTTILRAIRSGKLSAERDAQGAWSIQPCELHRVFPPLPQLPAVVERVQPHQPDAEVALLRTMLKEMRTTIADPYNFFKDVDGQGHPRP